MTNTVNDSLIGQLVDGRYLVRERVARGGMATVYRAVDKRLGRTVALKIMHAHLAEGATGQDFVARFRREARAAARVTHPGLVAVYDQGVDGDISYLTLEFVEGSDLRRLLSRKGTLSLAEALAITEDILDALAAAHRSQLVHRDVKPENVLLSLDNEVKLTDFGLARAVTEVTSTTTGMVLGTVAYLAPELVTTGIGDARTDIYAIGIMLYEMICGAQPFTADAPIHIAFQHVNVPVPRLRDSIAWVPPSIDSLIQSFVAKAPDSRPRDASDALRALQRAQAGLSPELLSQRFVAAVPQPPQPRAAAAEQESKADIASTATSAVPAVPDTTDNDNTHIFTDAVLVEDNSGSSWVSANSVDTRGGGTNTGRDGLTDLVTATSPSETIPLDIRTSGSTIAIPLGSAALANQPSTQGRRAASSSPATSVMQAIPASAGGQRSAPSASTAPQTRRSAQKQSGRKKPSRARKIAIIVTVLAVLGGGSYGGWYWWNESGPGSFTVVPARIEAVSQQDATDRFIDVPLTVELEEAYNDTVPAGDVISAEPASGERVKKESSVTLTVSLGIQELKVPKKLTGKKLESAKTKLTDTGFSNLKETFVYDTKVKKNTVLQISVKEGTTLPHNTEITLTVSNGPEPITVPQVFGKSLSEAKSILDTYELSVTTKEAHSDTIPSGEVISQNPEQGVSGYRGDSVTLTVSKGPELVKVPDVTGKSTEEATKILEDLNFKVKVNLFAGGFLGMVRFQDIKGDEEVPKGSTISLTVF